jgi:heme exporter protein B
MGAELKPAKPASAPAGFLKAMAAIAWKDLAAEFRSRELLPAMLAFSLLVILIFNFALELDVEARRSVSAGVLWATFIFAGTLGLSRGLAAEKDRGSLDGLLLAPVDRSAIYFGKSLSSLAFMLVVEAVVLPAYAFLYDVNLLSAGLLLVILLGSWGYAAVGVLLAGMAVQARTRELLLGVLLFPVAMPVLIAAVQASRAFLSGDEAGNLLDALKVLLAYDVIYTAVGFMVFDFVVEE